MPTQPKIHWGQIVQPHSKETLYVDEVKVGFIVEDRQGDGIHAYVTIGNPKPEHFRTYLTREAAKKGLVEHATRDTTLRYSI